MNLQVGFWLGAWGFGFRLQFGVFMVESAFFSFFWVISRGCKVYRLGVWLKATPFGFRVVLRLRDSVPWTVLGAVPPIRRDFEKDFF